MNKVEIHLLFVACFYGKTSGQNKRIKQANKTSGQNKRIEQANKASEEKQRKTIRL